MLVLIPLGLAQFLHKRQLRQEADINASFPPSEAAKLESDDGKYLDNKVVGAVEPVKHAGNLL